MPLRTRIFIFATAIILVILSISLFLYIRSKQVTTKTPGTNTGTGQLPGNTFTPGVIQQGGGKKIVISEPPVIKDPVELEKAAVKQIARVFIERYQTYSTDNNYDNIRQVQTLVTTALWNKLSPRLNVKQQSTGFVGATTVAYTGTLKSWGTDKATVDVETRRTLTKDGQDTTTNVGYTVAMVKNGTNWLIDSFTSP